MRRHGGGDGVARALGAEEESVALRVDRLTAARGELVADQAPVLCEHLREPVAEPLQELGRARDVGEDERDGPAPEHDDVIQPFTRAGLTRAHAGARPRGRARDRGT